MEAVDVLLPMSDYLQTNNVFKDMIKEGVWFFVKFLKGFIDVLEGAIDTMYSTLTLSVKNVMAEHMSSVGVIAVAVLGVAICILGYKFMFKRESNKSNSFTGVLLVLVICMGLPMVFDAGLDLFNSTKKGDSNGIEVTFTDKIIQSNLVDLAASIDQKDFGVTNGVFKPENISEKNISNIKYIDITEALNKKTTKEFDSKNAKENIKTLDSELHYKNDGTVKTRDFDGNKIINKDGYYRYQANWFSIFSSFIIVTITLVLMGVKIAKILFQLVLDRIVGTILIFSDLEEGKRAKELLNHILTTFTMLLVSVVSMDIYIGLVGTFSTNIQGEGGLTKSIAQT
ncbi:MAG: pLS20_p028 family conjugation system transmembrane protein, partial [Clostridium sp.]